MHRRGVEMLLLFSHAGPPVMLATFQKFYQLAGCNRTSGTLTAFVIVEVADCHSAGSCHIFNQCADQDCISCIAGSSTCKGSSSAAQQNSVCARTARDQQCWHAHHAVPAVSRQAALSNRPACREKLLCFVCAGWLARRCNACLLQAELQCDFEFLA